MEELPWKRLPDDCIDKILVRLPLPSAFRLRSVCKRWKTFIFSDAYFSLQSHLSSRRHCFLLSTHGRLACVYNFILHRWHYLPLPAIPWIVPPLSLTAASHSLLCFANQVSSCSSLLVCNPFAKSLRFLPAMPTIRLIHKLILNVDPSGKSYTIVVAGEEDNVHFTDRHIYKLITETYDSTSDAWTRAGSPSPDSKFGLNPGVSSRGSIYCLTELPYGIAAFDMATKTWKEMGMQMPVRLTTPCLMESRGRVLMAGKIKQAGGKKIESIKIWEMRETMWIEIGKMPDDFCYEFAQPLHLLTPLVCSAIENVICITTHLSPRVAIYDLSARKGGVGGGGGGGGDGGGWRWLPPDPLFPRCRNFHLLGFPLEPRMDTMP